MTKKMSERPYCYRCMQLPVVVAGELCKRCDEGWEPPRKAPGTPLPPLSEWTLEMLVETQEKGSVPGDGTYRHHESTFTDVGMW